jgi:hypothetical protein
MLPDPSPSVDNDIPDEAGSSSLFGSFSRRGLFGGMDANVIPPPAPPPAPRSSAFESEPPPTSRPPARRRLKANEGPTLFDLPVITNEALPKSVRQIAPAAPEPLDQLPAVTLGINSQDFKVLQLADGRRVIETKTGHRTMEEPGRPPGHYLRASNEADVAIIAGTIVSALDKGQYRSENDLRRLAAIMAGGDGTAPADPENVRRLVTAIDDQIFAKISEATPQNRQRALAARFHRFSGQGWPDLDLARDSMPVRRIFSEIGGAEVITVNRVTDEWVTTDLLPRLAALSDVGRIVIRVKDPDDIVPAAFREGVLSAAVRSNIIEGAATILPRLGFRHEAIIVFGAPRPLPVEPADIPAEAFEVPTITSPDQTWDWLDRVAAANERARLWMEDYRAGRVTVELDETRRPNAFQAPYVGLSKGQVRNLMVPAALAAATADAMTNLSARIGDVDEFVAGQIGVPVDHLIANFTGPQIDAAALNMDAHDRNRGFLLSDATGAGKTRPMALVARRAVMQGKNVIYMTEKSASFGDIIAEFQRCGLDQDINWFIMNNAVEVQTDEAGLAFTIGEKAKKHAAKKGYRTGSTLVPARKAAEIKEALYDAEGLPRWPEGTNILLTTYSQAAMSSRLKPKQKARMTKQQIEDYNRDLAKLEWKATWFKEVPGDNVLAIFDEVHNLTSPTSVTNSNLSSLVERASRVTYATATAGNEAKQMGAYYRLLPGNDPDAKITLPHMLSRGGLEASEALTVAFVADGVARRCGLDFSDVVVRILVSPNAERHRETLYSMAPTLQGMMTLARVMNSVIGQQNMYEMSRERRRLMELQNLTSEERQVEWRRGAKRGAYRAMGFSSPIYSIERTFAAVILAKEIGDYAVDLMQSGKKPVIQIDNTMQSALEQLHSELAGNGENTSEAQVVPSMRHYLYRVLEQITRVKRGEERVDLVVLERNQQRTSNVRTQATLVMETLASLIEQADLATPFVDLEAVREWLDIAIPETVSARKINYSAERDGANAVQAEENPLDDLIPPGDDAVPGEVAAGSVRPQAAPLSGADWEDVRSITDLLVEQVFDTLVVTPQDVSQALRAEASTLGRNPEIDVHKRLTMDLIENLPPEADLPLSYIDIIKETVKAAGYQMLEMTNRTLEAIGGVVRPREPEEVAVVKHQFQNTVGTGLIIGASGAASIGLHAAPDAADQSQRIFIPMQWFADPNKQSQILGRVKRAGEVNAPELHYYFSGIPTEARHISMMNRRFARLGANTDAARLSPVMISSVPDFHSAEGDKATARFLLENPEIRVKLGIEINENTLAAIAGREVGRTVDVETNDPEEAEEEGVNRRRRAARDVPKSVSTKEHQRLGNEVLMAATVLGRDQASVLDGVSEQYWAVLEEYEAQGIEVGASRKIDGQVAIRGRMVFDPEIPPRPGDPPSVFDKAITLNVITIQRDIQALRGQEVLALIDQAAMEGASRTFYAAAMDRLQLADRRELAGRGWTANDELHERNIARLRDEAGRLNELQPGMGIRCVSQDFLGHGIILRVLGTGEFNKRLELIFPGDSKTRTVSLPSAMSQNIYEFTQGVLGEEREQVLEGFDSAQNERSTEVRYLLTGSEPRMLASDLGRFTMYADETGEMRRGLLVSKRFETLKNVKNRIPGVDAILADILRLDDERRTGNRPRKIWQSLCNFNLARGPGAGTSLAGFGTVDLAIGVYATTDDGPLLFELELSNGKTADTDGFKVDRETFAAIGGFADGEILRLFRELGRDRAGVDAIDRRYADADIKIQEAYVEKMAFEEAGEEVPATLIERIRNLEKVSKMVIVRPRITIGFDDEEKFPRLIELIATLYREGLVATKNFEAGFSLANDLFRRTVIEGGNLEFYGLETVLPAAWSAPDMRGANARGQRPVRAPDMGRPLTVADEPGSDLFEGGGAYL